MESNRALELVTGQFDLVLLDSPYAKEQIAANIEKLVERELLSDECTGCL